MNKQQTTSKTKNSRGLAPTPPEAHQKPDVQCDKCLYFKKTGIENGLCQKQKMPKIIILRNCSDYSAKSAVLRTIFRRRTKLQMQEYRKTLNKEKGTR